MNAEIVHDLTEVGLFLILENEGLDGDGYPVRNYRLLDNKGKALASLQSTVADVAIFGYPDERNKSGQLDPSSPDDALLLRGAR